MQHPPEIPGVTVSQMLRLATEVRNKTKTKQNPITFHRELTKLAETLAIDPSFLARAINTGFSGGEKKKAEILQLLQLNPKYAILDETEIMYVYNLEGTHAIRMRSDIGVRKPAYCTAEGQAILAFQPNDVVDRVIEAGLEPRTPKTITSAEKFIKALGATPANVIGQVLLEALFVTTLFGYLGLGMGVLLLWAAVILFVLCLYPYVYLLTRAALARISCG